MMKRPNNNNNNKKIYIYLVKSRYLIIFTQFCGQKYISNLGIPLTVVEFGFFYIYKIEGVDPTIGRPSPMELQL